MSPITGYRFERSTAKAPQLLGSVQCNDSTRQYGSKPPASKRQNTPGTKSPHSNCAMAC